nr:MAG TPA: Receptor Binding Protein [Caudoviricetes sp.]
MANIKSFPNNQDEEQGAEDVMRWHHGRASGVFGADGNASVRALSTPGMAVEVSDGTGWMANSGRNGIVWWIDNESVDGAKLQLAVDAADGVLNRIDRVIVEWRTTNYVDYPEVKILKGAKSGKAVAPALTNNSTIRQISLARISVAAGTTAITASMITDERLDASVCGLVTEKVGIDTSTMQSQFSTLLQETQAQATSVLDSINRELADLEAGTAVELKKLLFTDTSVPVSAFVADSTYQDYPFRAAIALTGVLDTMIPEVVLGVADAIDGNFAPVAATYNGGVYLYAASAPESAITIPTIICWKGGVSA